MIGTRRLILGFAATTAIIAMTAALSAWPVYRALPPDTGVVKLAISHGGQRNCRPLSAAELAKLPPNMRRKEFCDRKRLAVRLELDIDGETVFARSTPPGGIAGDGPSRVYQRFTLAAGEHTLAIRLRDTARQEGFDASAERTFRLAPAQSFAIDFDSDAGAFVFN